MSSDGSLALYCDFENIALGVRDAKYAKFDMQRVLERLLVKGTIVVKKAYCDWDRYKAFKAVMHEAAFELIEIPHVRLSGKNSADIRMVVDALDLCYTKEHIDTFVIISGDSDFSPLVSKLRENAKTVIGVGVRNSTSDLLMSNCDEFIFYDDLVAEDDGAGRRRRPSSRTKKATSSKTTAKKKASSSSRSEGGKAEGGKAEDAKSEGGKSDSGRSDSGKGRAASGKAAAGADSRAADDAAYEDQIQEALDLIVGTAEALYDERGDNARIWGSMIKQTLKRRRPGFNEATYGFGSFNELLDEAQTRGLLEFELDSRSGGYVLRSLGGG